MTPLQFTALYAMFGISLATAAWLRFHKSDLRLFASPGDNLVSAAVSSNPPSPGAVAGTSFDRRFHTTFDNSQVQQRS